MNRSIVRAIGPLPAGSPAYVERSADRLVLRHLLCMEYVQITDPRQQGKTSLLCQLRRVLPREYRVAYVDMESLETRSEGEWYRDLALRLENQLPDLLDWRVAPRPVSANTWRELLVAMVSAQRDGGERRVVIALDEMGALAQPWAEPFFRVLREAFTVREFQSAFRRLSFLLVGAFDPSRLIKDPDISPFNVAQNVHLEDFSPAQLADLGARLGLRAESREVIEQLYAWTEGHPYLAHNLSLYLASVEPGLAGETGVATAAEWMLQTDAHFMGIRRLLQAEPSLITCARQLIARRGKLSPALNPQHFQLAHVIGVVKSDADGRCQVRNRLYEQGIEELLAPEASPPPPSRGVAPLGRADIFLSYAAEDRPKAKVLADALTARGWSVWGDWTIRPGQFFDQAIEKELAAAKCVAVCWSKQAIQSRWVHTEAMKAHQRGVLIPVLIEDVKLPLAFSLVQAADLVGWDPGCGSEGFDALLRAVESLAGRPKGQGVSSELRPGHKPKRKKVGLRRLTSRRRP